MNLDVSTSSAIVNMVPEVFNKVAGLFKKDKSENSDSVKSADIPDNRDTDDIELPEEMVESGMTDDIDFDFKD